MLNWFEHKLFYRAEYDIHLIYRDAYLLLHTVSCCSRLNIYMYRTTNVEMDGYKRQSFVWLININVSSLSGL